MEPTLRRERHDFIASGQIVGALVRDVDGSRVGFIEQVFADRETGRLVYALVRVGGWLGFGGDYRVIPWPLLRHEPGTARFALRAPLADLPDPSCWPDGWRDEDPAYTARVAAHFGVPEAWFLPSWTRPNA